MLHPIQRPIQTQMAPNSPAKRRSAAANGGGRSPFSFSCGCNDAKSVSVTVSDVSATAGRRRPSVPSSSADGAHTFTSASSSSSSASPYFWSADADKQHPLPAVHPPDSPTFSGLLRQLGELEQTVKSIVPPSPAAVGPPPPRHRRSRSDGGFGSGRVEESVAVVTESEDPLRDFRRSMLQMIVEKEIVGGEELRELLRRYLAINSPRHHGLILRAFADIWDGVFAAYERSPEVAAVRRRSAADFPLSKEGNLGNM